MSQRRDPQTGLTARKLAFAVAYLKHGNGTKAAVEVGYGVKSAGVIAYRLLREEPVAVFIRNHHAAALATATIDMAWTIDLLGKNALAAHRAGDYRCCTEALKELRGHFSEAAVHRDVPVEAAPANDDKAQADENETNVMNLLRAASVSAVAS
jgi:phage terminase small subunit